MCLSHSFGYAMEARHPEMHKMKINCFLYNGKILCLAAQRETFMLICLADTVYAQTTGSAYSLMEIGNLYITYGR